MHRGKDFLYLLTPVDGNSDENPNFENSFDFKEFPEVIRDIEKDYGQQDAENYFEKLSHASTDFNSPVDRCFSQEKTNFSFKALQFLAAEREAQSQFFFNISLGQENPRAMNYKAPRGKKLKTNQFMKKNWKTKLASFRENRWKKLLMKINFLLINKINKLNLGYQDGVGPNLTPKRKIICLTNLEPQFQDNFNNFREVNNFNRNLGRADGHTLTPPLYPAKTLRMTQLLSDPQPRKMSHASHYEHMTPSIPSKVPPMNFVSQFNFSSGADFVFKPSFVNLENYNDFTLNGKAHLNYNTHGDLNMRVSSFNY
jgi:hypothetical protein